MKIKTPQIPVMSKPEPHTHRNPKLLAAARLYEEQFLRHMVKEMRKTVNYSGLVHSGMAGKIFREKLDDQYVKSWTKDGGIGLADLIYKQVIQEFGGQFGINPGTLKHHGFFPIDPSMVKHILRRSRDRAIQLKIMSQGGRTALRSPWPGQLVNSGRLDGGEVHLKINHENGLSSEFVYRGSQIEPAGASLASNQTIGWLDSGPLEFSWNLLPNPSQYDTI